MEVRKAQGKARAAGAELEKLEVELHVREAEQRDIVQALRNELEWHRDQLKLRDVTHEIEKVKAERSRIEETARHREKEIEWQHERGRLQGTLLAQQAVSDATNRTLQELEYQLE